jgi:hypothetical protein
MAVKKIEELPKPKIPDKLVLIEKAMSIPWLSPAAKCVLISAIIGGFEMYSVMEIDTIMQCTLQDIDDGFIELQNPLDKAQLQIGGLTKKISVAPDTNTLVLSEDWR